MYQVVQQYGGVLRSYTFQNRAEAMEFLANLGNRAYNKGYAIVPEKHAFVECTYHFIAPLGEKSCHFELIRIPDEATTYNKIDIPENGDMK